MTIIQETMVFAATEKKGFVVSRPTPEIVQLRLHCHRLLTLD